MQDVQNRAATNLTYMRTIILVGGLTIFSISVAIAVIVMTLIRQRTDVIYHQATHDKLTNLPNRASFIHMVEKLLSVARRHERKFAILFIDVDRFKEINDTYGHAVGDEALLALCNKVQSNLRESDTLARLSGDEFVVLMEEVKGAEDAAVVSERVINSLHNPVRLGNADVKIGVSIGIAVYPEQGDTTDSLLTKADAAMYESKRRGRNCWSISKTA